MDFFLRIFHLPVRVISKPHNTRRCIVITLILFWIIALAGCSTVPAETQPPVQETTPQVQQVQPRIPCGPRPKILEVLAQKHGEAVIARGLTSSGELLEIFSSPDGRTWSVVVSSPQGTSCLVAAGEWWQPVEPVPTGPEA